MKMLNNSFLFALWLLPILSMAGQLKQVSFENAAIIIQHNDCQLMSPIQDKHSKKLILPVTNCTSNKGTIRVTHPELKQIHWAQHEPFTVWIVATFAKKYKYNIASSPHQYKVFFPACCQQDFPKYQSTLQKQAYNISNTKPKNVMFSLQNILFQIPLQSMLVDDFLARSIGFKPKDMIRDGLPHFGSKRDDWKGKARQHIGYDIYADKIKVIASAQGVVHTIGKGGRSGLYVKLYHGSKLYTAYVHLRNVVVKKGQKVKRGDIIGTIDGAVGNAIAPQLHFEIKLNNKSVDPLPLIEQFYQNNQQITNTIIEYKMSLQQSIHLRNKQVKNFLLDFARP